MKELEPRSKFNENPQKNATTSHLLTIVFRKLADKIHNYSKTKWRKEVEEKS